MLGGRFFATGGGESSLSVMGSSAHRVVEGFMAPQSKHDKIDALSLMSVQAAHAHGDMERGNTSETRFFFFIFWETKREVSFLRGEGGEISYFFLL